jgi:adenylosuccinate lyase
VDGVNFWPGPIQRNLRDYGVFAASERLLMEAAKAGGDRQELHEVIREHSLVAWQALQAGQPNPLVDLLCADPRVTTFVDGESARTLMDASDYVGDAPIRAREVAGLVRDAV